MPASMFANCITWSLCKSPRKSIVFQLSCGCGTACIARMWFASSSKTSAGAVPGNRSPIHCKPSASQWMRAGSLNQSALTRNLASACFITQASPLGQRTSTVRFDTPPASTSMDAGSPHMRDVKYALSCAGCSMSMSEKGVGALGVLRPLVANHGWSQILATAEPRSNSSKQAAPFASGSVRVQAGSRCNRPSASAASALRKSRAV